MELGIVVVSFGSQKELRGPGSIRISKEQRLVSISILGWLIKNVNQILKRGYLSDFPNILPISY